MRGGGNKTTEERHLEVVPCAQTYFFHFGQERKVTDAAMPETYEQIGPTTVPFNNINRDAAFAGEPIHCMHTVLDTFRGRMQTLYLCRGNTLVYVGFIHP